MSAAKVRIRYAELGQFLTADERARGFREYAVERHEGRVTVTLGLVYRAPDGPWKALHLGPVRHWGPDQPTRDKAAAELAQAAAQVSA